MADTIHLIRSLLCLPTVCVYYVYVCRPQYSLSLKECDRVQARAKELQQQLTKKEDAEKMRGVIYDLIVVYHLIVFPIKMVNVWYN